VLTLGDYLLWNWSLNGNHDVLALVSGLTLPPLVIACLWLLALTLARLLARSTRRSQLQGTGRDQVARDAPATATTAGPLDEGRAHVSSESSTSSAPSSGKLAA
jgi:hypothetical protein